MRFALSDGVSGASYSREWAELLTNGFIENSFLEKDFEIKSWITPLQLAWYENIPWKRLEDPTIHTEGVAEKARKGGSATFLGGLFEIFEEKLILKVWALGDTNLFIVRDGENITSFPLITSEEFGIDPDMFFSLPRNVESSQDSISHVGELKFLKVEIQKDDVVICSSDSISKWYVDSLDNPSILPWIELDNVTNIDEFRDFVTDKVQCKNMKNDDSTLLVMRF